MSSLPLEERVALLEAEMLRIKRQLTLSTTNEQPWWEQITGTFASTPAFEEAVRLGRAYREAQSDVSAEVNTDDVSA